MATDPKIQSLVEEVLESGRAVDEVCRECPELLAQVREALRRVQAVEAEVEAMFPGAAPQSFSAHPPSIPGYEIIAILGHGGMGVVYHARHLSLDRPVALKMLLSGVYAGPAEIERFRREAVAVAQLHHPNIVQIYDVGELEGRPFFTMELLDGGSLATRLSGAPQSPEDAARLLITLAEAAHAAHVSGFVHRDIKPANILLAADGTPKIADFGLARAIGGEPGLTLTGARLGTPSYMAPEQALGKRDAMGPTVDVYALGAVLYEVLTGRPPFRAESPVETERQVIAEDPAPPSRLNARVPRDLETICLKCLSKEARHRYATAADLANDLRRFQRGEPIGARRAGRAERLVRWARRKPTSAALVAATLALVGLGIGTGLREWALAARERQELAKWADRLDFVTLLEDQGRFAEARTILGRVPDAGSSALQRQILAAQSGLTFLERLDALRLGRMTSVTSELGRAKTDRDYLEAFTTAGWVRDGDSPEQVAERIRGLPMQRALVTAIDEWAFSVPGNSERLAWLMTIARRVDPDPWRDRVRDHEIWGNRAALTELAQTASVAEQPVSLQLILAALLTSAGGDGLSFRKRVQAEHPDDFWANAILAQALGIDEEAIGFHRAALALRPRAFAVYVNLAAVLMQCRHEDEGMDSWKRALAIDPGAPSIHLCLAIAYMQWGELERAIEECREAIRLDPKFGKACAVAAWSMFEFGSFEEAAAMSRRALELLGDDDPMRGAATQVLARCERVPALEARLARVLDGSDPAPEDMEHVELAEHLLRTKRYEVAASFYKDVLTRSPELAEDVTSRIRYNAACAAARAGIDGGPWREQAIQWLRADQSSWESILNDPQQPGARRELRNALRHWKRNPNLASLRDDPGRLTDSERTECAALWRDVDALMARDAGHP